MSGSTLDTAPPAFAERDAAVLAEREFGVAGRAAPLVSERDQNFLLTADDGRRYVLKIANPAESPEVVDFQIGALRHVAAVDPELALPRPVAARHSGFVGNVAGPDGRRCIARLVTYVEGIPLGRAGQSTARLQPAMGALLARLGRALRGYFHPAARHELIWNLERAGRLRELLPHVNRAQRELVADVLTGFEAAAAPVLPRLRAQVIHNDLNPGNVLVDERDADRITGVIDVGDLVHAPLICDLAVAAAYQLDDTDDTDDTLAPVLRLVAGYHLVTPLERAELDILFDLVRARVATTVLVSSWRAARYPENRDYILTSNPRAVRLLARLAALRREDAAQRFRAACGLPSPASGSVAEPAELIARRERVLGPAYRLFYDRPVHIVRAAGARLYAADGTEYLDAYNNVPHVGHCHPRVVAAIAGQTARLSTHTRYLHEGVLDYAERLAGLLPFTDPVCLFCCTGSEANELAYRIARAHTGGSGVVVTRHAYHGNTSTVAQFSTADTPPERRGSCVETVDAPDSYRGARLHDTGDLASVYAAQVERALRSLADRGVRPAMLLIDTIHSCDGVISAPPGYLAMAAAHLRAAGGLFVADEVQAGFGRSGEAFWGFERHGIEPDIVTLGKPMGNGYPLAAVVTSREIVAAFADRTDYFNTFGGNPVACAAGMAVLEVLEDEGLRGNASRVGARLRSGLDELRSEFEPIGDVRGAGLFVGVELVRDRHTLEPARDAARRIVNGLRDRRVLTGATGPHGNVLKIRPPMPFSSGDADRLLDVLRTVMRTIPGSGD